MAVVAVAPGVVVMLMVVCTRTDALGTTHQLALPPPTCGNPAPPRAEQETERKIEEVTLAAKERVTLLQQELVAQLRGQLDYQNRDKDAEKKRAAKLMTSTMKRMLCAQLAVGWQTWLSNVGLDKNKNKGVPL